MIREPLKEGERVSRPAPAGGPGPVGLREFGRVYKDDGERVLVFWSLGRATLERPEKLHREP